MFSFSAYSKRGTDAGFFEPGSGTYQLSASVMKVSDAVDRKGKKQGVQETLEQKWARGIPVAARAMLHAGATVVVGGSPDVVDREDPWKMIEGRGGGRLVMVSAANGKILAEFPLESPPVLDGMAAARGRLFVALQSGKLVCLESTK